MARRVVIMTLRCATAVVLLSAVWTLLVLLTVRDDLARAQDAFESARDAASAEDAVAALSRAERELSSTTGRLSQPGPAVVARTPVLGRSVAAVRRTAAAGLSVARSGRKVVSAIEGGAPLLADGRIDTARLLAIQEQVDAGARHSQGPVAALLAQPLGLVPGLVADPVRRAQRELAGLPDGLRKASAGLRGVRAVLGTDREQNLLVLLENNAELRGTGGIVTVFARATVHDGRLDIGPFQDVEEVADSAEEARVVPAPADYRSSYGRFKADTTLWKNANMAPDIPTSSAVVAEVAALTTGSRPDAILWLDVPAIAAVLRATGPARLQNGSVLRAEDVVPQLLSTAYAVAPDSPEGQGRRRAALRATADAVIGQLLRGPAEPDHQVLARGLAAMARGRHLALWSADPQTQSDIAAADLAGAVTAGGGDISAVALHNLGGGDAEGNKLDYYGRRQTTLTVTLDGDSALVEQEVAIRNTAPARGLPLYVSGRATPGVMNSLVALALPRKAQGITFTRDSTPLPPVPRTEGDHNVVDDVVSVPPGVVVTWRLGYRLPLNHGHYGLTMYPQPLAVDAGYRLDVRAAPGVTLVDSGNRTDVDGNAHVRSGPFAEVLRVDLDVRPPGRLARWLDTVSRFWNEPVRLP